MVSSSDKVSIKNCDTVPWWTCSSKQAEDGRCRCTGETLTKGRRKCTFHAPEQGVGLYIERGSIAGGVIPCLGQELDDGKICGSVRARGVGELLIQWDGGQLVQHAAFAILGCVRG